MSETHSMKNGFICSSTSLACQPGTYSAITGTSSKTYRSLDAVLGRPTAFGKNFTWVSMYCIPSKNGFWFGIVISFPAISKTDLNRTEQDLMSKMSYCWNMVSSPTSEPIKWYFYLKKKVLMFLLTVRLDGQVFVNHLESQRLKLEASCCRTDSIVTLL